MATERFVKICPRCGSLNIGTASGGISVHDFCKDCNLGSLNEPSTAFPGFTSNFPEVKMSEVDNFREGLLSSS